MGKAEFVHLHCHTEYSLLDGAARIPDLVRAARAMGLKALAVTDHGALYGVVGFYKACREEGLHPILGVEVYVAPRSRFDKRGKADSELCHLTLLAASQEGYRNLMRIVSKSFLEGFYYKPRVDRELLAEHREGLICLSGCLSGELAVALLRGHHRQAESIAAAYRDLFGPENYFLEVMFHHLPYQEKVLEGILEVHRRLGIPLVASNDVHYIRPEDADIHDILLCVQTGKGINDPKRLRYGSREFYLRSPEEMERLFGDYPESLKNTLAIAERCQVELSFGETILPHFEAPLGYTLDTYLRHLCYEALPRRFPTVTPEIQERLDYELEVIAQKGYSAYFLVVWDFIRYAKERGIRVGPGRGSAAGSLVSYVLGITEINPLQYGLFFERFLNPERQSAPDIDIDFPPERRDEVIQYVVEKYGAERTAKIITFGTLGAKAAIRDVGRALEIPTSEVDRVAKLIPERATLRQALEAVPELADLYASDATVRQWFDAAIALEGMARHTSVHAAGVVISRDPLTDYVPLALTSDGDVVTQFEMSTIEEIGLLKMDFLGLRTLTVIDETLKLIRENHGIDLDTDRIPLDDPKTFELLSSGDTVGVFQLESEGFQRVCKELKPDRLDDIIALVALYRPGPMEQIPHYIANKRNPAQIQYLHPKLKPILEPTYGIIIYQEQVMQIGRDLAGFSMAQAERLQRAMSKKKREEMEQLSQEFLEGCERNGIPRPVAEKLIAQIESFAQYAFNKSHSAAYAVVAYWTAYLKANYPVEFMAAQLTSVMDNRDKLANFLHECLRRGLEVLPPNVNRSGVHFRVEGSQILYGLGAIKNLGQQAAEAIVQEREARGPFRSLYDFCERVDLGAVTKSALELLIKAGAFSDFGNRASLLEAYPQAFEWGQKRQRERERGQIALFLGEAETSPEAMAPSLPQRPEVDRRRIAEWEQELLGAVLSYDPLREMEKRIQASGVAVEPIASLEGKRHGEMALVGGQVVSVRTIRTRRGERMMFALLRDRSGDVELSIFPQVCQRYGGHVREGAVLLARGTVDKEYQGRSEENGERWKMIPEVLLPPEEAAALSERAEGPTRTPAPSEEANGGELHLVIHPEFLERPTLERLRAVLEAHPGSAAVFLHLQEEHGQKTIALGKHFQVERSPSLEEALLRLLGRDALA